MLIKSVRKSILAMLYGKYVENGTIELGKTLREIELNDIEGLLPQELQATIEHLITARSGVYHPASNAGDSTASAPPRGSQRPGAYYLYNNWDFNAAGAAFEKLTGRDVYDALEADLAQPIGMQDFDRARQRKTGDAKRSQHMAYHMHLSTRDMARIGLLMLRGGDWNGRQVVSRPWVTRIVSLVTPFNEMNPPPTARWEAETVGATDICGGCGMRRTLQDLSWAPIREWVREDSTSRSCRSWTWWWHTRPTLSSCHPTGRRNGGALSRARSMIPSSGC